MKTFIETPVFKERNICVAKHTGKKYLTVGFSALYVVLWESQHETLIVLKRKEFDSNYFYTVKDNE